MKIKLTKRNGSADLVEVLPTRDGRVRRAMMLIPNARDITEAQVAELKARATAHELERLTTISGTGEPRSE